MRGVLRLCVPAGLIAAVVAAAVSAANPASNGRILLVDSVGPSTGLDLFTVAPDGADRRQLTFDARNSSPVLSPDGERVAFLKSDGSSPRDLYVMNADGTGGARLIATHPEASNAGGIRAIAWSPDASRIAYALPGSPAIRVIDARDGTPHPLAQEGDPRPFATLEWSPDGTELLYDDGGDVWAKPVDGRPARRVVGFAGQDTRATWSPDGGRIAFIHSGSEAAGGVYVVRRDSSDVRHVAATGTATIGVVRWKPDGTAVVFDATRMVGVGPRNINLTESMIFVAGAEGSVLRVLRTQVARPIPSPDNARILIGQAFSVAEGGHEALKRGVYVMNHDGTCLTLLTSGTGVDWQRAPATPINAPQECVDLVLSATAPRVTGLRGVAYDVAVSNAGTQAARDVHLVQSFEPGVRLVTAHPQRGTCVSSRFVLRCALGRLSSGASVSISVLARPENAVRLKAELDVGSSSRDSDPASDSVELETRVRECWISGSDFNDTLGGTAAGEHICGFAGADVIDGLGGNDTLDGGWQADRVIGGTGRDRLIGGRGNDTLLARDGVRDVIECGWGQDEAVVDRVDVVRRGCERVLRR